MNRKRTLRATITPGNQGGFVLFATQKGTVKKTSLEDFANCRKGGIIAIGIEQGDNLIEAKLTSGASEGGADYP